MPVSLPDDAIAGLLLPIWQLVLGCFVLLFVVVAAVRLAGRGRSRMRTAVMITGLALIGLVALQMLTSR